MILAAKEFFDQKKLNMINLNLGQLFEILVNTWFVISYMLFVKKNQLKWILETTNLIKKLKPWMCSSNWPLGRFILFSFSSNLFIAIYLFVLFFLLLL